ncbi:MAG: hypothetical protein A2W90_05975 [Bacteroidetes bacterium GWF2_42_66]|nr:MAG: hypothetical protein A2W92_01355 [Bacteroidetes bacterium GWA2_42_15]OFY03590.1 MAG: hypothetical protein A2W89_18700 [Bacteroidetes bacterium GWE2_42_39]OFY45955.1 MAG: hypothetical protein A2W90_05975 [Bacteroidetes bacterium GWF2_42_66]HBL75198.1 hypothetical protein [Prolixibacteraceae bacterium]HCR89748.1 hypothetical protein [Prolixibacteraceae bacterium]
MMKEDKYIDRIFHDKLTDYEKVPPAFVWDNIEAKLAGEKHRKLFIYWRVAGVAAALLIAFIAGWQFSKDSFTEPETIVENIKQQPIQNEITVTKPENSSFATAETTTSFESINQPAEKPITAPIQLVSGNTKAEPSKPVIQKTEKQGFIESLHAVLKSQEPGSKNLAEKNPLMEKVLFSAEELRIIEENKALLAMNTSAADERKWMVGAAVSPVYSVSQSSHNTEYAKKMATPESNNDLTMAGGLSFEYKTQKKWSFQSGVYYNKLEQASSNSAQVVFADNSKYGLNGFFSTPVSENNGKLEMNSVAGVIQIDNLPSTVQMEGNLDRELMSSSILSDASFNQNFEYVEIPLFVKYQLVDSKVGVQVLSGLSTNILVGNNVYLQDQSGKSRVGKTDGMVDLNYSGVFGLGLNYSLTSNLYLNIEPRFKYYFNSLNEDSDVSYKPYSFGVYTGISYSF